MAESRSSIMGRLKEATRDLHTVAEHRELQHRMAAGTLERALYVAYLDQMCLIHRCLETRLRGAAGSHPAFESVLRDHHLREPQLAQDLAFFGADPDGAEPLPATARLLQRIEQAAATEPVALLGMLYVLEGSTNGAKFIARALSKAQALEPGPGLSYLDPHGALQKERWLAFKRDMDAARFDEDEADAIIDAARTVFRSVADMSDELLEPVSAI